MWMIVGANGYTFTDASSGMGNEGPSKFDALVIEDGQVLAIGTEHDLRLQLGSRIDSVLDVEGATIIPGLIDSHLHVAAVGEKVSQLNLEGITSAAELLQSVHAYAQSLPSTSWIVGRGWDDNRFTVPGLPSLQELDGAAGGRPLLLTRICHHAYLANTVAFDQAGLTLNSNDPADGYYGRDTTGRLDGRIYENASRPLLAAIPRRTSSQWTETVRAGMQAALRSGITAVHTDDVRSLGSFNAVWDTYSRLIHEQGVRLRVHQLVDWHSIDEASERLRGASRDPWLTRGAAKLFADGAMGSRTAWLSHPYHDSADRGWVGTPIYEAEELLERVRIAHEKGFGAAVHAIGDAAVDLAVRAMTEAPLVGQRDRLVHAQIIREDLIPRMQALASRLAIDIQPRFTVSDFPWVEERVGEERVPYTCAWRTMADAGLHIAGGSDSPIEPLNPILGIHAALTRRAPVPGAAMYQPGQCLELGDAIRLFTKWAAFAAGQETQYGAIKVGAPADLTILDTDIVRPRDVDDLLTTEVRYTIVGGHIAYSAGSGEDA